MTIRNKGKRESRQESEDRFRLLFNYVADALFLHDLDGRFVEVNQAACESLGYTQEELLQLSVTDVEMDLYPEFMGDLWGRISQGEKLTVQGLQRRKDGTTFPVELHLGPFEYAGRWHILASARDITQRLWAEEALRTSEFFLYSIVDQSPYPMWISDAQGTLIKLNQACQDLLHLSSGEVVGNYNVFQDNIVAEQGLLPLLHRVFEQGETVRFEITYDTALLKSLPLKTAASVILDITVSPIIDGRGQVTNAVFQHVDITQRKRAEAALAESEQRFSTFMDFLPAGVFMKDQSGHLLFANRYLKELFGWGDCLGKTTDELLPPEFAARMVDDDRRALSDGSLVIQERIVDRHREEHFFDTYKFPVMSEGVPALLGGVAVDVTARKRAVDALELSEKKYRSFYQSILDGFIRVDMTGKIAENNQGFLDMLGYTQEEIQELRYQDITPAKWHKFEAQIIEQQVLTLGYSDTYEKEYIHKDGTIFPVELRTYLVEDESGAPQGMWAFVRDITDRKQAEEALKKEKLFTEAIVDSLPGTFFLLDAQGRQLRTNRSELEITGYSREELTSMHALESLAEEDRPAAQCAIEEVLEKGEASVEAQLLTKDGRKIPFFFTAKKFIIDDEPYILGTGLDITARKQAEEALQESEERFRRLSAAAFEAIIIHEEGLILSANDQFYEMFGYKPEELLGKQALPLTVAPEAIESMRKNIAAGSLEPYESIGLKKDGTKFPMEIRVRDMEYEGRKVRVAAIMDITERRRAEEALRESEERYRSLFHNHHAVMLLVDPETGVIMDANPAACAYYGFSKEDLLTQKTIDLNTLPPEQVFKAMQRAKTERRNHFEFQHRLANGEIRDVEIYTGPIRVKGQELLYSIIHDVTARKKAEEALRESERILKEAQEMAHLGFWRWNVKTGEVTWSEEVYNIFQLDPQEFTPTIDSILELSPWPGERERDQELVRKAMESHEKGDYEQRFILPDKSIGYYYSTFQGKYDEEGNLTSIVGTVLDITERKLAEDALRQSEARFRLVVESSPLPFGLATTSGKIEYLNPKFVETFGYTLEDIPHLADWFRLAYPDPAYRQSIISQWQESVDKITFQEGTPEEVEVEIACKDGSKRIMQIFGSLMGDRVLTVFNDLTERKRMEEALEKRLVALSRPLDDAEDIDFDDLFNLNDIQQIQDLFAEIAGVASLITAPDGTPITQPSNFTRLCREIIRQTELGSMKCSASDAQLGRYNSDGPNIHHCLSAGLCGAGASITVGGKHIANWLIGQVRDELHSEKRMRDYARDLGANEEEFIAAFREVPLMSRDRFRQVAQALFIFANQLSNLAYHNVQQARFITERNRMEERLREKERKYRSLYLEFQGILNTIPDILCLLSPDLRIVWGNEATAQALPDTQLSDILGKHCYPLRVQRSEPCEDCPVVRCFSSGKIETAEVISFGDIYELRAVPLYDDHGELRGAIELARNITERKQAEEQLLATQERLELALQGGDLGTWDWNVETGVITCNKRWAEMLGYTLADIEPHFNFWKKLVHPEELPEVMEILKAHLEGHTPFYETEHRLRHKSGEWVWVLDKGKVIERDFQGKALRACGTHLDITERKRAEEALRNSERRLSEIIDFLPDATFAVDLEGKVIAWNRAIEEMTGVQAEDIIGKGNYEYTLPFYGVRRPALIDLVFMPDEEIENKYVFVKKDGDILLAEAEVHLKGETQLVWAKARLLYDSEGHVVGAIEAIRDITERKLAERALRESETRFRQVVEQSPMPIAIAKGELGEYLNPKFVETLGYTLKDLPRLADWFRLAYPDPDYRQSIMEKFQKVMEEAITGDQTIQSLEVDVTCKDGSVRTMEIWGSLVGGKTIFFCTDLTERKLAEEERARMEAQMREVQKLESLGVLAGGIAHDFNNLLMAILGNADLALLSLSPASPARPNVEEITRASQRAADLCRQMLAYSGKGRFVVGRYDLSEIVREMTQMLEISVSKKATLRYSFGEELPPVEADATQLRQVVMNLITNASEALEDRSGYISVYTGVMDCDRAYLSGSYLDEKLPEGRYVYLEVADTGCGLDEETRGRIFDPFFTTKFTGRGLGLAAVLGIVRGHRGAIKVYSEPSRGTTFKILLPAGKWMPGDRAAHHTADQQALRSGTILLIDDDPDVRHVGSQMLERLGFKVLSAAHGLQGLEVFRAWGEEIDCVLLDLTMPEMSGDEVFRELRRLRADVRVILSSGYNEQEVTQRFVGKGLAGFIQKPYTVVRLQEVLTKVFDK